MCFRRCRWRNRVHYSVPAATPTLAGLQALAAPPAARSASQMQCAGHQLHIASELNCQKQLLLPLALPLASTRHAYHSAPYAVNLQCQK
ncbi:hypothetical protein ACLKA7_007992 [Drosophila subpalustris]